MSDIQIPPLPDVTELYRRVNRDGLQAHAADVYRFLRSALPSAPQASGIAPEDCLWARNGHQRCPVKTSVVKQEPVAWRTFDGEGGYEYRSYDDNETYAEQWAKRNPRHVGWVEPLYTHQAPVREPLTDEQDRALCEAHFNAASDEYFKARPQLDNSENRRIFYAGHRKAWITKDKP